MLTWKNAHRKLDGDACGDGMDGMEDRIYLLWIGELLREKPEAQEKQDIWERQRVQEIQDAQEVLAQKAAGWIDGTRRQKAARMRTEGARAACMGAGLLLQKGMADYLYRGDSPTAAPGSQACRILRLEVSQLLEELETQLSAPVPLSYTYGPQGKPYLAGGPFFFSLSHSGDYVLCAVSGQEVGADIQKMQQADYGKLASRFFAGEECRLLEQCRSEEDRRMLFYWLWTRKEALGKLTGRGVAKVLARSVCGKPVDSGKIPGGGQETGDAPGASALCWTKVPCPSGYQAAVCTGYYNWEL